MTKIYQLNETLEVQLLVGAFGPYMKVTRTTNDGKKFWLNLDLFCINFIVANFVDVCIAMENCRAVSMSSKVLPLTIAVKEFQTRHYVCFSMYAKKSGNEYINRVNFRMEEWGEFERIMPDIRVRKFYYFMNF